MLSFYEKKGVTLSLSSAIEKANFLDCSVVMDDFKPGISTLNIYNSLGQLIGVMKRSGKSWTHHAARGSQLKIKVSQEEIREWDSGAIFEVQLKFQPTEIDI